METTAAPELYHHGIQSERSVLRAHVGIITKHCYVFPQSSVVKILQNYPAKSASQPGVIGITALGRAVPWSVIPDLRAIPYPSAWTANCLEEMPTEKKGQFAVTVVRWLLRRGEFPLALDSRINEDFNLQVEGLDIMAWGQWRIEVKCDFRCGHTNLGGTGNLFIQTAERNPLRRY